MKVHNKTPGPIGLDFETVIGENSVLDVPDEALEALVKLPSNAAHFKEGRLVVIGSEPEVDPEVETKADKKTDKKTEDK